MLNFRKLLTKLGSRKCHRQYCYYHEVSDCSAFSERALDVSKLNSYFSGGNGTPIEFDESRAKSDRFNAESIALAKDLGAFVNDYAREDRNAPPSKSHRVDWFFSCASKLVKSTAVETEEDEAEIFSECTDNGYSEVECVCGTWAYPKPTEGAQNSPIQEADNAHDYLLGQGFHRTYWPWARWNNPAEYTRPRTYQSNLCRNDSFRDHAVILKDSITQYKTQTYSGWTPPGEPNPEVLEYWPHPYWLWTSYVAWWHNQPFSH